MANTFNLLTPFPIEPFKTQSDFELFACSCGTGFTKANFEEFVNWCASKYYDLTGIDIFELDAE